MSYDINEFLEDLLDYNIGVFDVLQTIIEENEIPKDELFRTIIKLKNKKSQD